MNNRRDDAAPLVLGVIAIVAFLVGMMVWKFSEALGLDFAAGGKLLMSIVFAIALLGLGWWQESQNDGILTIKGMAPAALAVAWLGLWPALQQWGSIGPMFHGMDAQEVEWWANGLTRWLVLLAILLGGYYYVFSSRNSW
ncbi:hypothetical protein AABC73_29185 (plasmid) [Pseudomonas sp. G.S.17]|uniref:hypothetical protein n=1 Tax=Pseudomonas sp. G.S.17 TaxID=3137451 RepID=UPI00311C8DE9